MVLLNDDLHLLVLAAKRSNLGKVILFQEGVMERLSYPEILHEPEYVKEESSAARIKLTMELEADATPQSEGSHVSGILGDKINVTIAEQKAEALGREKETVHGISTDVVNEVEVLKNLTLENQRLLKKK
ncbi:hypothetical protein [Methanothermobacter sp.]|uniref:hypothetical protein n=1 Tax=Methanothermobacter sp. TaxID=1884223 RepID=UPI0026287DCC|nr:hypothetical protein [Methanothermobacter sp.]MDI9618950.1 hypothetical protein [Methanothermobacter sp.]